MNGLCVLFGLFSPYFLICSVMRRYCGLLTTFYSWLASLSIRFSPRSLGLLFLTCRCSMSFQTLLFMWLIHLKAVVISSKLLLVDFHHQQGGPLPRRMNSLDVPTLPSFLLPCLYTYPYRFRILMGLGASHGIRPSPPFLQFSIHLRWF